MTIDENGDELPKLKLLLHRIRFSLYTRQRSGLLRRLKDDNQTLATLTDQQRALKTLGTYEHPDVTVDVAACRKMHQQVVDVFDSLASNVAISSEHWFAHAASILFTSFMASGFFDRPSFSIVLNGLDQNGVSQSLDCQIARCSAVEHKYLSICSSYPSFHVPKDDLSTHPKSQHRWSAAPPIQGCLRSPAEPFEEYILKFKTIVETPTSISLAGIVSADRNFACYPRYFLENDRARLAATLALSLLCLHDSPWLRSSWSSRDLLFETASGDVSSEALLRPYTKVAFPHAAIQSEPHSSANMHAQHSISPQFGILNQSLYSLGMVLLELIMNETLESAKLFDDETEQEVAWRLEREVCGRAGPRWAVIVFACLHCPFQKVPDLANEDFLHVVALNIVMPLIEMAKLRLTYAEPD